MPIHFVFIFICYIFIFLCCKPATKDELLQAHTTTSVSSSAPPKEKKPKLEEVDMLLFYIKCSDT